MKVRSLFTMVLITFICISCANKEKEIYIAAGAGYRKPVDELKAMFEKKEKITVNCIYGNMRQVTTQVKNTGKVSLVIGDAKFLSKSGIDFKKETNIGKGRLVLAFDKSLEITSLKDLDKPSIDRIILPDAKKAIYGRASHEALKKISLYNKLKKKLVVVQTVPQVSSYLTSGTARAGFLNKTDFIALDQNKFSSMEIDNSLYSPIMIEAALTSNGTPDGQKFLDFIQSKTGREIFAKYGLGL